MIFTKPSLRSVGFIDCAPTTTKRRARTAGIWLATGSASRNWRLTFTSSAGKRRRVISPITITEGLAVAMASQLTVGHSSVVWMTLRRPSSRAM